MSRDLQPRVAGRVAAQRVNVSRQMSKFAHHASDADGTDDLHDIDLGSSLRRGGHLGGGSDWNCRTAAIAISMGRRGNNWVPVMERLAGGGGY